MYVVQSFNCKSRIFSLAVYIQYFFIYCSTFLSSSSSWSLFIFTFHFTSLCRNVWLFDRFLCNVHFYYKLSSIHITTYLVPSNKQGQTTQKSQSRLWQKVKSICWKKVHDWFCREWVRVGICVHTEFNFIGIKSLTCCPIGFTSFIFNIIAVLPLVSLLHSFGLFSLSLSLSLLFNMFILQLLTVGIIVVIAVVAVALCNFIQRDRHALMAYQIFINNFWFYSTIACQSTNEHLDE